MQHTVLVDYELAVAQQGFIVRAMLKLEGKAFGPPLGMTNPPLGTTKSFHRRERVRRPESARAGPSTIGTRGEDSAATR